MEFKADCSFLQGDILAPNCMAAQCLVFLWTLRFYDFVVFILTGYLVSTRTMRNRMCPELIILVNFWIDDETLLSRWFNYKNSAFVEWAMPSRRVLISFGRLYPHVYCILFVKSVTAGINFYKYPENSI